MMPSKFKLCCLMLVLVVGLAACQAKHGRVAEFPEKGAVVATFEAGEYDDIPAERGRVFRVDSAASQVRFYLWRGGVQAAKGHNHVMVVSQMQGAVFLPADMLEDQVRFDIVFEAADIDIDPPRLRKELGGGFAKEIPQEGIEGTRRNMLGERVLDAERFPTIGLSAEKVHGELPKLAIDTVVTLHGIQRRVLIPVTVTATGSRLSAEGSFVIKQTDFGIDPITALGGALYVQDPVMVEFTLQARPR